jgi:4'-phosphopantetheinyl transferase
MMNFCNSWTTSPQNPAIEPGWVHIYHLTLDLPSDRLSKLAAILSEDEHLRAMRYLREIDQRRFIAARGQIRSILAVYLGMAPGELHFIYNPYGKPSLSESELRFNLSHSDGIGLLGVAFDQEIGIDVERLNRPVDYSNIIRRFFAPGEIAEFFSLPDADKPRAFCSGWTRKEAFLKALGMGMSFKLDGFEVNLTQNRPGQLISHEQGWSLYNIDPGEGYVAALVVEREIKGIRYWKWGN